MKIGISLLFLLLAIQFGDVRSQTLQDTINDFRNLYRQGIESLRRLCNRFNGRNNNNNNNNNVRSPIRNNRKRNFVGNRNATNIVGVANFRRFCNCRIGGSSGRIVGGLISANHSFPWQVSLGMRYGVQGNHFCGGSIINERMILTAMHCLVGFAPSRYVVRVGVSNLKNIDPNNTYLVDSVISYVNTSNVNISLPGDFAIMRLQRPIQFVRGVIEPGCFDLSAKNYSRTNLVATGFGATARRLEIQNVVTKHRPVSDVLKQATFRARPSCANWWICIQNVGERDAVCMGDSGGPLHLSRNGRTTIEGVSSATGGNRITGTPVTSYCNGLAFFAKVSYYSDWFKNIVGESYCKF